MKYRKILLTALQIILGVFVFFLVGTLLLGHFGYVKPIIKPFVVQSGSMEPAIKVGSVVVSIPQKDYQGGDILTFALDGNAKNLVTHRLEAVLYPEGIDKEAIYLTSGDANEEFDRWKVKKEHIVGKVILSIQYLGYMVEFAKKPQGFTLLVIIPATIIIYEELKFLKREIGKNLSKLKSRFKKNSSGISIGINLLPQKEEKPLPKIYIVAPMLGAIFVIVSLSAAYFFDLEGSFGNILGASSDFSSTPTPTPTAVGVPTPTPTPVSNIANHLVINEVMFNPDNPFCTGGEPASEWVEIYNPTGSSVSLNGWTIYDGNSSDSLPNVTLNAGSFAIVTNCDSSEFTPIWPLPGGTLYIDLGSSIGNGLANGGDEVRIDDSSQVTIDHVSYGTNTNAFNPSVPPPIANHTIERDPDGIDTNTAVDFVDRTTPTPGS